MRTIFSFLALTLLTSCISVETRTPAPPVFVTSTLPALPAASSTPTATEQGALPRPENCTDEALLVLDVTYADGSRVKAGESFTKTWRLRNTGTCPWDSTYHLVFLSGERMGAPDSVSLPVTAPTKDADVSVNLVAPLADGSYTTYFQLRDPKGKVISIGLEQTIWLKVIVGNVAPGKFPSPVASISAPSESGGSLPIETATHCTVSENAGYVSQLLSLINDARRAVGIPALTVQSQLTTAAQSHSRDMACNNFLAHNSSDGSWIDARLRAAGYAYNYFLEIIAIGTPENAMSQWQADAAHWDAVMDSSATEVGIGYAYNAQSDFGGYFTVDLGRR